MFESFPIWTNFADCSNDGIERSGGLAIDSVANLLLFFGGLVVLYTMG